MQISRTSSAIPATLTALALTSAIPNYVPHTNTSIVFILGESPTTSFQTYGYGTYARVMEALGRVFEKIKASETTLPTEFTKPLYKNLWQLYATD